MALNDVRVVGTLSGNAPEVVLLTPKAASTFRRGEFVRLNAANEVTIATAGEVFGIAAEDAVYETGTGHPLTGTVKASVKVWPLNADTVFSAVFTGTVVAGEYGKGFDIDVSAGHKITADTAGKYVALIKKVDPADATRVLFTGNWSDATATNGSQALNYGVRSA